jgi:multiple sugar transport system permease protein
LYNFCEGFSYIKYFTIAKLIKIILGEICIKMKRLLFNKRTIPYWLIAPTIIYVIVFWLRPVIGAFTMSLKDPSGNFTFQYYMTVFQSASFLPSLWNTVFIAGISVTVEFAIALLLAVLLNKKFKGVSLLLFIAMLPMAIPPALVGIMWRTGFDFNGWINSILYYLGVISLNNPVNWLGSSDWNLLWLIIFLDAWTVIPSVMIILLAGLQNIQKETQEAGYAFGASKLTVLTKITIPLLKPTIVTAVILRLISAIQIWMIIVMLVNFGRIPVLLSQIVYYVNKVPNLPNSNALAAAYSVVVTIIVAVSAIFYLKVTGSIGTKKEKK